MFLFSPHRQKRFSYDRILEGADGAILVFDVTRPESLNNAKLKWQKLFFEKCQTKNLADRIIYAGNKIDLKDRKVLQCRSHFSNFCDFPKISI